MLITLIQSPVILHLWKHNESCKSVVPMILTKAPQKSTKMAMKTANGFRQFVLYANLPMQWDIISGHWNAFKIRHATICSG